MEQHDNIWARFQQLLDNNYTASANTFSLLTFLKETLIDLDINIEGLDAMIVADAKDLGEFLNQKAQQQNIPANTKALWLNIDEYTHSETKEIVYASSIKGCKAYDDEDNFWNKQVVFQPQGLISLDSVAAFDTHFNKSTHYEILDWILPLATTAFAANEAIDKHIDKSLFLKNVVFLEVTIGYADGDFIGLHPIFVK